MGDLALMLAGSASAAASDTFSRSVTTSRINRVKMRFVRGFAVSCMRLV